jgi:hypothetical protein
MSCWRLYCAVGVTNDASTVVGISTTSGNPALAGLPYAVDVCDVPFVSAAVEMSLSVALLHGRERGRCFMYQNEKNAFFSLCFTSKRTS